MPKSTHFLASDGNEIWFVIPIELKEQWTNETFMSPKDWEKYMQFQQDIEHLEITINK